MKKVFFVCLVYVTVTLMGNGQDISIDEVNKAYEKNVPTSWSIMFSGGLSVVGKPREAFVNSFTLGRGIGKNLALQFAVDLYWSLNVDAQGYDNRARGINLNLCQFFGRSTFLHPFVLAGISATSYLYKEKFALGFNLACGLEMGKRWMRLYGAVLYKNFPHKYRFDHDSIYHSGPWCNIVLGLVFYL